MNLNSMKAKLALIGIISVVALLLATFIGIIGLREGQSSISDIGNVRLPSVVGLMTLNDAQTAVKAATLTTAIFENDYTRKGREGFALVLKQKKDAWEEADRGWKIYEPLPQTKEEEGLWHQFEKDWAAWKAQDAKLTATIEALATNEGKKEQEALFVTFYNDYMKIRPLFAAADASINKVTELNIRLANEETALATKESAKAVWEMIAVALVALIALIVAIVLITRSIFKLLGGEPGVAAEVANRIATGDMTSHIELKAGDKTSLMASMQAMVTNLTKVVTEVRSASDNLSSASVQISSTAQSMS